MGRGPSSFQGTVCILVGPPVAWRRIIEALPDSASNDEATLPVLVEPGEFEIRTTRSMQGSRIGQARIDGF